MAKEAIVYLDDDADPDDIENNFVVVTDDTPLPCTLIEET
jgi:hypothetical protein